MAVTRSHWRAPVPHRCPARPAVESSHLGVHSLDPRPGRAHGRGRFVVVASAHARIGRVARAESGARLHRIPECGVRRRRRRAAANRRPQSARRRSFSRRRGMGRHSGCRDGRPDRRWFDQRHRAAGGSSVTPPSPRCSDNQGAAQATSSSGCRGCRATSSWSTRRFRRAALRGGC